MVQRAALTAAHRSRAAAESLWTATYGLASRRARGDAAEAPSAAGLASAHARSSSSASSAADFGQSQNRPARRFAYTRTSSRSC